MLWVKAFHLIFMVTWFAGLFYLPRLFVYHAASQDTISNERFKTMERRLFYGIMTPGGLLTTIFGVWLLLYNPAAYFSMGWMHVKLTLIIILWLYHGYCGYCIVVFNRDQNQHSDRFYRYLNEFPTLILISVVILAVVKPF